MLQPPVGWGGSWGDPRCPWADVLGVQASSCAFPPYAGTILPRQQHACDRVCLTSSIQLALDKELTGGIIDVTTSDLPEPKIMQGQCC